MSDLHSLRYLSEILDFERLPYFICHGTLLGLIRDSELIAGDHDIDICFLHDEVSTIGLLEVFDKYGIPIVWREGKQLPRLEIPGSSRYIDLNIYVPFAQEGSSEDLVATYFRTPRRLEIVKLITALTMKGEYQGRFKVLLTLLGPLMPIAEWIQAKLDSIGVLWFYGGYVLPRALLEERKLISVDDLTVSVPAEYEQVLELLYGDSWRVPSPSYAWDLDSPSCVPMRA